MGSITLPEDKKKILDKEIKAVEAKLEVVTRFKDTVAVVEEFCTALVNFDNSLKAVDGWKDAATAELKDIKEASGAMLWQRRVDPGCEYNNLDRAWRKEFKKSTYFTEFEQKRFNSIQRTYYDFPEFYKARYNIFRRMERAPLNVLEHKI